MPRSSLRAQLSAWLLVPLALIVAANAWLSYRNAAETATVVHDRLLIGSARVIAEAVRYEDGAFQVEIPPAALELFQSASHDLVYYRIVAPSGLLLSGYAELPTPPHPVNVEETVFFDSSFRGEPVRVVAFGQPVFAARADRPLLIEVAQTLRARGALAQQIWAQSLRQQLLIFPLVVLFVLVGLRRGLAPLLRLRGTVQSRRPGSLEPLDAAGVPAELAPLVNALNDYVRRLDDHMSAHGRFIANASHQLRTPLTLLNTQVAYALSSSDPVEKQEAEQAIQRSVRYAVRVANQLLMLSAAESGVGHPPRKSDVDLVQVVRQVLEELAAFAEAKSIDLGFEPHDGSAVVLATPSMLHELVANLVDNAIRYTPRGGRVTAEALTGDGVVVLRIEDNGPGIPPEERERVFERFYRLREDRSDGCGLGLAIVREIAAASEGRVALSAPPSGTGLVVTVTFPVGQTPAAARGLPAARREADALQ
jgi:two-component system sensor histidine kinase TctE